MQPFNRYLLSPYYVPDMELHVEVDETDRVLSIFLNPPSSRGEKCLVGNNQYTVLHVDALP
jgi:hypothetical protein